MIIHMTKALSVNAGEYIVIDGNNITVVPSALVQAIQRNGTPTPQRTITTAPAPATDKAHAIHKRRSRVVQDDRQLLIQALHDAGPNGLTSAEACASIYSNADDQTRTNVTNDLGHMFRTNMFNLTRRNEGSEGKPHFRYFLNSPNGKP